MEKIINLNGIDFKVIFDLTFLLNKAKTLETFEKDTFTGFYAHWDEPKLTEEQFNENVKDFCENIEKACEDKYIEKVVSIIQKKKNGTFCKNRKHIVSYYGNTHFFQEWHNTWGTYELRFSAIDDTTLRLEIVSCNYTPG